MAFSIRHLVRKLPGVLPLLPSLLLPVNAQYDTPDIPDIIPEDEFFTFVSRPDIRVPKWDITIFDKSQVTPGYWFTAPYEVVENEPPNPPWVGPQIYDGEGNLIWSSTDTFKTAGTFLFRTNRINGTDYMSVLSPWAGVIFLLDEHYEIQKEHSIGTKGSDFNMHEFNIIDDSTRALIFHRNITNAPEDQVIQVLGHNAPCKAISQDFEELDLTTDNWDIVYRWDALEHVSLNESTMVDRVCFKNWDFLHSNSVDKCPDGHYVLSARHTDTIYKISKDDGSIIWRLGGLNSDFESDFRFSRQHHVRCRNQNETHTTISFLDNAVGPDTQLATNDFSRGLLISLDTQSDTMEARIISQFAHPEQVYNIGRGNLEVLANGNVWMGWSDRAMHSEHTHNGRIVMKAMMQPSWLRSYRTYKLPFIGRPKRTPDVVSVASAGKANKGKVTTRVHVSWNGATEVAYWNLYRSDEEGSVTQLIIPTIARQGFETELVYGSFASYIVVEALDTHGQPLENGRSAVIKTAWPSGNTNADASEDVQWQQEAAYQQNHPWLAAAKSTPSSSIALFLGGVVVGVVLALVIWWSYKSSSREKTKWWSTALRNRSGAREWQSGTVDEAVPMFDHSRDHDEMESEEKIGEHRTGPDR